MEQEITLNETVADMDSAMDRIDFKYLMEEQLGVLEGMHAYYFQNEVSPENKKWEKLSDYTIFKKGHDQILMETGDLLRSLTERNAPDAIREVDDGGGDSKGYLVFGTSVEYAHWHMSGPQNMPARPMVGITEWYADKVAEDVADLIAAALAQ